MKKAFILLFTMVLTGCGRKTVFDRVHPFEKDVWRRFDFVMFDIPVSGGEAHDFYLTLRFTRKFEHRSFPMNITITKPDGEVRSRDIQIAVKNKKGLWLFDKERDCYTKTILAGKQVTFHHKGVCKVRVEQKVPLYEISGVKNIELTVR